MQVTRLERRTLIPTAKTTIGRPAKPQRRPLWRKSYEDSSTASRNGTVHIEREVIVSEILEELGDTLVFEDTGEEDVWDFEERFTQEPQAEPPGTSQPQIRHALDANQADILTAYSAEQGFLQLSVEALEARLRDPVSNGKTCVLDVRVQDEYKRGHIPGSVNVPFEELSGRVRSGVLDTLKLQDVAVVCESGATSAQAAVRLKRVFGFSRVSNLKGGMQAWGAVFDVASSS